MRDELAGPLGGQYLEYTKIIADSGSHLLAIINDILDIARAEAGRLNLSEEEVDIAAVVALSASMIRSLAEKAEVECSFDVADDLPPFWGDPTKLRQILINLLSNAIKFTPAGGKVRLTAKQEPEGGVSFCIEDTGIGIPAEKMAVALAPFGQVESSLARQYDGVGLGLPLTKRLLELHDGTLEIVSEPGKGTGVTAHLPPRRFYPGGHAPLGESGFASSEVCVAQAEIASHIALTRRSARTIAAALGPRAADVNHRSAPPPASRAHRPNLPGAVATRPNWRR
jgi:signal transduction histidine kinase